MRSNLSQGTAVKPFYVYLLASRRHGTLYIGVTSDLARRVWEHKTKAVPGFTARYGCDRLVWYEVHDNAEAAITREKRLKQWRRDWKVALIERDNPEWRDLYEELPR
jgi:putative endonuclease